jgi:hypothetical protein
MRNPKAKTDQQPVFELESNLAAFFSFGICSFVLLSVRNADQFSEQTARVERATNLFRPHVYLRGQPSHTGLTDLIHCWIVHGTLNDGGIFPDQVQCVFNSFLHSLAPFLIHNFWVTGYKSQSTNGLALRIFGNVKTSTSRS